MNDVAAGGERCRQRVLELHRELLYWEGRSGFAAPYPELSAALRAVADAVDAWTAERERLLEAQDRVNTERNDVADLEFQIQELRGALASFQQGIEAEQAQLQAAIAATNGGGQHTTDINGFYAFSVDSNWSGTVTPSRKHYTFEPNMMTYVNVDSNLSDQNYIAVNIYDLDCDGTIGLGDFAVMADNWLMTGPGIPGDFVADEIVNFLDFAQFAFASVNNSPTVSIISPLDDADFNAPATVTINATASDIDGAISKVDFYRGSTLLGTDTTSPYSYTWNNVTDGNYILTAKATDDEGAVTTSSPVSITVNVTTGCTCTAGCDSRTIITADFVKEGAGEFCWESTNLGTYINNWGLDVLNINGTDYTNTYVFTSAIPKIDGKYYVYYKGANSWSHFEAKN